MLLQLTSNSSYWNFSYNALGTVCYPVRHCMLTSNLSIQPPLASLTDLILHLFWRKAQLISWMRSCHQCFPNVDISTRLSASDCPIAPNRLLTFCGYLISGRSFVLFLTAIIFTDIGSLLYASHQPALASIRVSRLIIP